MTTPTTNPPDAAPSSTGPDSTSYSVEIFYDSGCSLCSKEIALVRRLDRRGRIRLTDIVAPGFDAAALGTDFETLMRRIHGRLPDGTWIEGVDVFREMWGALGLRWLIPITRLPGVRHLLQFGYVRFARWRYRRRCESGTCPIPLPK